jgi:hypothetical protein
MLQTSWLDVVKADIEFLQTELQGLKGTDGAAPG